MKIDNRMLPLMGIILICLLNGVSVYSDIILGKGIIFKTGEGGPIFFDVDITASRIYFENNYLMILNVNNRYNQIGVSCVTEDANITITQIASREIHYTINAPSYTISITKIRVGNKGKPLDVDGAFSWSYSHSSHILTINVLHQSPSDIIIKWDDDPIQVFSSSIYSALGRIGPILAIMSVSMIIGALTGRFELESIMDFVITCVVVSIIFSVIVGVL